MVEAGTNLQEVNVRGNELYIFVGPEGAGKSAQAKLLAKTLNKPYISTGDIIREIAKNNLTQMGQMCRDILERHTYLDAKSLLALLQYRLSQEDVANGAVLDGALRTAEEVEGFEEMLNNAGRDNNGITVISLRSSGWESVDRLITRGREDDNVDGSLKRLGNYYLDLGHRMAEVKRKWRFIQVPSHGLADDEKIKQEQIVNTHKNIIIKLKS